MDNTIISYVNQETKVIPNKGNNSLNKPILIINIVYCRVV